MNDNDAVHRISKQCTSSFPGRKKSIVTLKNWQDEWDDIATVLLLSTSGACVCLAYVCLHFPGALGFIIALCFAASALQWPSLASRDFALEG